MPPISACRKGLALEAQGRKRNPNKPKLVGPDIFGWGGGLPGSGSGKEKTHKHKQNFPVTARVGGGSPDRVEGGSPDRWPGVKSLCAVCGTQGT